MLKSGNQTKPKYLIYFQTLKNNPPEYIRIFEVQHTFY
ncbi:Uncharacterised protein [Capnocytophaga canimorsus]|nr:hypothetical protein CLV61_0807 [Capnocytophaga canimorsus]STA71886.1 Uncharacterised protein [Capnocytophaga canimorsus]